MAAGCVLALVRSGTPVITHVHELDFQLALIEHTDMGNVQQLLARTDRYIAVSNHVADTLVSRYGIASEQITTCYGFLSTKSMTVAPGDAEAARKTLGVPQDTLVVGSVGKVEWRKGADLFLQLARRIVESRTSSIDIRFIWIGGVDGRFWELAVQHDLRGLALDDRVRFLGPTVEPRPLISLMDVFVLTSRSDPFPLTCLEAAALAKPIVCFDAGGMTEFFDPEDHLVIPYLDIDAMAERVLELLAAPDERHVLGERLARRVRERHDVDAVAPVLVKEIKRMADYRR
jgi:glycosyltransferase involved in cell wall biosynthesis